VGAMVTRFLGFNQRGKPGNGYGGDWLNGAPNGEFLLYFL